jgi:hypothetical protein
MKAANSYASLLRGVSQQVPQDRADGQHTEQINMLSDPVNGLSRRHGSVWQGEQHLSTLSAAQIASYQADVANWVSYDFDNGGKEYLVLYRKAARPVSANPLSLAMVYNKTDKVFLSIVRPVTDTGLDALESGGVAALTSVGKYLFMTGNTTPVTGTSTDRHGSSDNLAKGVVWVRGGAYSRTFKITVRRQSGAVIQVSYTTPKSSYQGALSTADLSTFEWQTTVTAHGKADIDNNSLWSDGTRNWKLVVKADVNKLWLILEDATAGESQLVAGVTMTHVSGATNTTSFVVTVPVSGVRPDYTKLVNDRVNAYTSAVTAWIGTASAAVQPDAIAEELKALLNGVGYTASRNGSHICFDLTVPIKSIEVDDGGDGSLLLGVADEIESAEKVSVIHYVGKVVKVRSKNSQEAYYLKAIAKDSLVTTGYTEVTWVEGAGMEHAITGGLTYGTVSGSNFYVASSAVLLTSILAGDHPVFTVSTAGDNDSAPAPFFVGRKVTYLGTFQNRLLVGSCGALAVSQTDDYLNFFRTTVLTLPASDPFEMMPQGSEDDELFHSALYDQDIVIFGKRRQYVISGTVALTPTAASMPVMASYEAVADAAPVAAGGFIFFVKRGDQYTNVFQIQPGQNDKSPEAFPASSQIDRYIAGGVTEMLSATGSPSLLFMRTNQSPNSLYVFAYLDKPDGRKMDAWSRWDFNAALGSIVGFSNVTDGIVTVSLRVGAGSRVYAVADFCPVITGLSTRPYLDSVREYSLVSPGTGSVSLSSGEAWAGAFDFRSTRRLTGTLLPSIATLQTNYPGEPGLMVGAVQAASFTPTSPFMRDGKDKAILSGRLTVSKLVMAFKNSTGFAWSLTYRDEVVTDVTFNGRILGDPTNVIGIEPIATGQHNIPVGRETRQYDLTISARRWYPLTVTALEWSGQFFNRVQRF